jgi:hypothetical protein
MLLEWAFRADAPFLAASAPLVVSVQVFNITPTTIFFTLLWGALFCPLNFNEAVAMCIEKDFDTHLT